MRLQQLFLHAVAVVTLGSMCMAQSSTGCASQDEVRTDTAQHVRQDQREIAQNETNNKLPATMSRNDSGAVTNESGEQVAKGLDTAPRNCEADPRIRTRLSNIEKLTEAQQSIQ